MTSKPQNATVEVARGVSQVFRGVGNGMFGFLLYLMAGSLIRDLVTDEWEPFNNITLYTLLPLLAVIYAACGFGMFLPGIPFGRRIMPGFYVVLFSLALWTGWCADL